MKKPIGLKDRDGKEICVGDNVEFYVEYDGYGNPSYNTPKATRMVDKVIEDNGRFYFWNDDVQNGAFAWRHADKCRVIG